jgi:hypothetical protein
MNQEMLQAIEQALKVREESVEFLGRNYLVREINATEQLGFEKDELDELRKATGGLSDAQLLGWSIFIHSVRDAETGELAFTANEIPMLARGSRSKLAGILSAANRVNGLDGEDNAKK